MIRAILQFLSTVVVFVLLSQTLRGFYVDSWGTAVLAALVFGFVNATIGTVLRILSLPLILVTLVAFLFGRAFQINGWWPAIVASVVLAALGMLWKMIPKGRRERDDD
jgi:putative membrane protein